MNWYVFHMDGTQRAAGKVLADLPTIEIPTHGSVSIRIGTRWFNFKSSEWMKVTITEDPDRQS